MVSTDLSGAGMTGLSVPGPAPSRLNVEYWKLQNSFPNREDVFLVQKGPGRRWALCMS